MITMHLFCLIILIYKNKKIFVTFLCFYCLNKETYNLNSTDDNLCVIKNLLKYLYTAKIMFDKWRHENTFC